MASLMCTVAPFLAVGQLLPCWLLVSGTALFVDPAAGMGLVVGTAAFAVALAGARGLLLALAAIALARASAHVVRRPRAR